MRFNALAGLAALVLFAAPAAAVENFAEVGASAYNISTDNAAGSERSTGAGAFVRGRLFVEGQYFVQGDIQLAFTDGKSNGEKRDLDLQFYRAGVGASNGIGDGNAVAAVWAEFVRARAKREVGDGTSSVSESSNGGAVHLRFDRFAPSGRFLPYLQIGYVFLRDLDGPEGKVGVSAQLGQFRPFVEYQYLRLKDGDVRLIPRSVNAGLRVNF